MSSPPKVSNQLLVLVAQGFGAGRSPIAPGTFGSVLGLAWFGLLLVPGNLAVFAIGMVGGLGLSVWLSGVAEEALQRTDPGSVVIDEIAAMPLCFAGWIAVHAAKHGEMPGAGHFFSGSALWVTISAFVLFRVFDIAKPWPVKQSQSLRGGWGVTADDVLAGVYTAIAVTILAVQFSESR